MSRFLAWIYDPFMAAAEASFLKRWRADLLRDVGGDILEIGGGTGVNLKFYGEGLRSLTVTEPDEHMRHKLQARVDASRLPGASVRPWPAEHIELPDSSVDAVVSTLVMCSVADLDATVAEIHRVLKPGGKLHFLEHVRSSDERYARWQARVEPLWLPVSGGCHLCRRSGEAIAAGGFRVGEQRRENMPGGWINFTAPSVRGVAVKE